MSNFVMKLEMTIQNNHNLLIEEGKFSFDLTVKNCMRSRKVPSPRSHNFYFQDLSPANKIRFSLTCTYRRSLICAKPKLYARIIIIIIIIGLVFGTCRT